MKLVDTLAEQALLEHLLEKSKPPVPPECRHLHYLLATPFRYGAPYPRGSRFRRPGLTPGVFYASQTPATAMTELTFHRLLFFAESPQTPWPANAGEHTAFAARFSARSGLDLTTATFDRDVAHWSHPTNYAASQDLAETARAAGVEAIRYRSIRDARDGFNIALLTCGAFTSREPIERQTWRLHLGPTGARAICNSPPRRLEFDRSAFDADPRIASLGWER